ncbi:MAG: hypothetical protein M3Q48_09480 [Actinomycetota bacterium]|nr:hypothetical protein [Actinomycetota bacterium]
MPTGRDERISLEPWRRHAVSGVVVTAVALGLRTAVEGVPDPSPVVVEAGGEPAAPPRALELHFDAGSPAETWVVVRPHLLASGRR